MARNYQKLSQKQKTSIRNEVKALLRARQACMLNGGNGNAKTAMSKANALYNKAAGIMKGLEVLGYKYCWESTFEWWLNILEQEVATEFANSMM